MANWESQTIYSGFDAKQYTDQHIAGREGGRSEVAVSQMSEYDVVGINVGKIPSVQQSINDYVTAIMNQVDSLNPLADASKAFRSEDVQAAVEQYITTVKEYCTNLTSQLRAFNDKLVDVQKAWEQGAGKIAEAVGTSGAAYSTGTEYQSSSL